MRSFARGLAACAALLASACGSGSGNPPASTPRILVFIAMPTSVIQGRTARLAWETESATEVSIATDRGDLVPVAATLTSGNVETPPLTETRDFVLTARSAGGVATARVTVSVLLDPTEVGITRFDATPLTVAPGGSTTLSWDTVNATGTRLSIVDGPELPAGGGRSGSYVQVNLQTTTSFVLVAEGPRGPKSQTVSVQVEGTPVVDRFETDRVMIEPGESATLSWTVRGAPDGSTCTLLTTDGATVAATLPLMSTQAVSPVRNTAYVLRVDTPLGQRVRSAPLSVGVGGFPRVLTFTATPDTVSFGDPTELVYRVENARSLELRSPARRLLETAALEGRLTVTATRTTTFTLIARNDRGDTTQLTTVTVNPAAPRIPLFVADPSNLALGEQTTLRWEAIGATELLLLSPSGAVLLSRTDPVEPIGSEVITVTATRATYVLEARNPSGTTRARAVVVGVGRPEITQLDAQPRFFTGTSTVVTVQFNTRTATATSLRVGPRAAAGFTGGPRGSYTFTATDTVRLELLAQSGGGLDRRALTLFRATRSSEVGNTSTSAIQLAGRRPATFAVLTGADADFYAIQVPEAGNVTAATSDPVGSCGLDTTIELYAPDGRLLGSDDDDGVGPCSEISPLRDAFAAGLPAGRYLIAVRGFGVANRGGYVLSVEIGSPACGNGFFEPSAREQCDDGNVIPGDGCDGSCVVEPLGQLMGPGGRADYMGRIGADRPEQLVRLDLTGPALLEAETFVPALGRCDLSGASRDTVLTLYDANFQVLGRDDDGGLATCSRVDPAVARFARLDAGTYYLGVREGGDDEPIIQFVLRVALVAPGCGNGVLEGAEVCDDGNVVSGDGCTAMCTAEGLLESEPNDSFATAPLIGSPGAQRLQVIGGLLLPRDIDVFRFTVPAGYHLDAVATLGGFDRCREDARLELRLYDAAGVELARDDDGGPEEACGRIWPYSTPAARSVPAGTYGVAVTMSPSTLTATASPYFLDLRLIPAPACGNRILEGTELCDDGNAASGDGCSATCTFEPLQTITLPTTSPVTITGSIDPSFRRDAYGLVVTTTVALLRASTIVDAVSQTCFGADTVLSVYGPGGQLLGSDDDDGVDGCSRIEPSVDAFARLSPGQYLLVVESRGYGRVIPGYQLDLTGSPARVCGNLVREPGEECDGEVYCDTRCRVSLRTTIVGPPGALDLLESIVPVGDRDFYQVTTTTTAYLVLDTGVPLVGQCTVANTTVRVIDRATFAERTVRTQGPSGNCAAVELGSLRLPVGSFLISVEEPGDDAMVPGYQIRASLVATGRCGNGLREGREQCDDGNTAAGDGCSNMCLIEPEGLYTGPGSAVSFTGEINPVGDRDLYELRLAAPSLITAEVGSPAVGSCMTADSRLTLLDANGVVLGSDDDSGPGLCSLISGATSVYARVPAGTYTIRVEEAGDDATLTPYELRIDARAQNQCGNGLVEGMEQCDDGNNTSNDGCSTMCLREIRQVTEVEQNSLPGQAQDLGVLAGGGAVEITASFPNPNDRDFYRFTLTAPAAVVVGTFENAGGWLTRCPTIDTELWVYQGQPSAIDETDTAFEPTILGYDDEDGPGSCSLVNGNNVMPTRLNLQAGTYWVQVRPWFNIAAISQYLVRIDAQ